MLLVGLGMSQSNESISGGSTGSLSTRVVPPKTTRRKFSQNISSKTKLMIALTTVRFGR